MTTPHTPPPPTDHTALRVLRADLQTLSPTAARWACIYLAALTLTDWWASALLRDAHARAGTEPWPEFETLVAELGRPGHWQPVAFIVGDAMDLRLWLAAVQALATAHAPSPPPLG